MSDWIEWGGGDCPVKGNLLVDVKVKNGTVVRGRPANSVDWLRGVPSSFDVVAYRLSGGERIDSIKKINPKAMQVGGNHYKDMQIQPVEFIHANGIGYMEGNVIKYVSRWHKKNGIADLEKAKHYIELLIAMESKE